MASSRILLRLGSSLAVVLALGGAAIACKSKGNGIGTAPTGVPCPDERPAAASVCSESNVCPYSGTCADPAASGSVFFFCPGGTNAAWKCIEPDDGGAPDARDSGETSLGDADAGETDGADVLDGETNDDADAGDVGDADATDVTDATDAPDAIVTADVSDETDAPDGDDAADAGAAD